MPAPDPVAEAITRGLQAMIAEDTAAEQPKPKGWAGLIQKLRRFGSTEPRGK